MVIVNTCILIAMQCVNKYEYPVLTKFHYFLLTALKYLHRSNHRK